MKELARPKPDPKLHIDPVFCVSVNGLTHPVSPNEEQMMQLLDLADATAPAHKDHVGNIYIYVHIYIYIYIYK